MPARRPMPPADIRRQVVVEQLDLARDGRLAVAARRSIRGDRLGFVRTDPIDGDQPA